MTDITFESEAKLRSTASQRSLARANRRAVADLYAQLRSAAAADRRSDEQVAAILGTTESVVREILDGDLDLSLSDLQDVALAVDAQIGFVVNNRYSSSPLAETARQAGERAWRSAQAAPQTGLIPAGVTRV